MSYDDPVTVPAGDIADNPYWKRDARRSYPRLSFVNQSHAVGLLSVGSAAQPKQELVGESGQQALVAAKTQGETGGLAAYFEKTGGAIAVKDLLVNGLPPTPGGQRQQADGNWDVHRYEVAKPEENAYPAEYVAPASYISTEIKSMLTRIFHRYPCRSFK
jgi:hypothetical protein